MKATTAKQVLIAAKWIIDNVGWCQNAFGIYADGNEENESDAIRQTPCVAYCLSGAVEAVETTEELRRQTETLLNNQLGGRHIGFNDTPGRTKQEVLDALDRAIEVAT